MGLKQAIIDGMKVKQLRKAVRDLGIPVESYQKKRSLANALGKSRRAKAEALMKYLSEKDVKRLCDRQGIESRGRRRELIARLMESTGTASISEGGRTEARRGARSGKKARGPGAHGRARSGAADLRFGFSTDRTGFTPAGIAAFSDLRPAAVVRELIQNSLDAALIEAREPCAHVRFERGACKLKEIPGIKSYRAAFRRAVKEQKPSGSARSVVARIRRTLGEEEHDLLCVTDNGVGLDGKRMSALLSDGVSAKGGSASGTFGNGHSVVLPASNLRYVMYGGLAADGQSYGAGQAVLASHSDEGDWKSRSGRGVYLESFKPISADVPFTLAQGDAIPQMVASAIDGIRTEYGHGAAVIIPAFNNFEHDQSLQEAVFKAAGFNFFQAIHEGKLVVEVVDSEGGGVLDTANLREALAPYSDEMRSSRSGAFLSGRKANEAYEALVDGESYEIDTTHGVVELRLLRRDSGRRSVGLCRNGMWVTDELPMFQHAFSDRQPFQALILLGSDSEDGFFKLIQEAETPLHDKLAPKQMDPARRKALRDALREIRDAIAQLVPPSTEDVYSPKDILAFQFEGVEGQGRGGRQPSFWGQVGTTRRPTMVRRKAGTRENGGSGGGGSGLGGGGGRRRNQNARIVTQPIFRIASVPSGERRRTVHVECTEEFEDAELRMFVDENVDATCDRQTRAQAAAVVLSNVKVDGRSLADSELVCNGEGAVGAKLGFLSANTRIEVEAEYAIPSGEMRLPPGQEPALRIEVLSSREISAKDDGETADEALPDG